MKCTHHYLQEPKSVRQPMGLADFIRGSVALHQYCKEYDYSFFINKKSNKLFDYLSENEFLIDDYFDDEIIELCTDNDQHLNIINLFEKSKRESKNINIYTNLFYKNQTNSPDLWSPLDEYTKSIFRKIFNPSKNIQERIDEVLENVSCKKPYNVIHLRCGDNLLYQPHNGNDNTELDKTISQIRPKINSLINNQEIFILICDSDIVGQNLAGANIKYWSNKKTHLGEKSDNEAIQDTLVDFFIMSKAKKIYSHSIYSWGSGFSRSSSVLFDIEYKSI